MWSLTISLSLVCALAACVDQQLPIAPAEYPAVTASSSSGPPTPVNLSFILDGPCGFSVLVELDGKEKVKELPGGLLVISSPGLNATLTNLDTGKQAIEGITGTIRVTFHENGDAELGLTGRNLVEVENGLFITIGNWSLTVDLDGNSVQPLQGKGKLIDVCELLG